MTRKVPDAVDSYKKVLFLLAGIIVVVVGIFLTMSQFKEKEAEEALRAAKPTTDVRFTEELTVYSGMDSRWIEEILIGYCIKVVGDKALIVTMGDRNVAEYDPLLNGPYKIWRHEHHFKAVEGGVLVTDIVSYKLPLGFLGKFAHWLFVRKQLETVFEYRFKKVESLFNK